MRRALPRRFEALHLSGRASSRSIAASVESASFAPSPEKNLMPLSSYGLCEALITMPAESRSARVR